MENSILSLIRSSRGPTSQKDVRTLIQVIKLVFEKATDEVTWSEMYAHLCRKMMEQIRVLNRYPEGFEGLGGEGPLPPRRRQSRMKLEAVKASCILILKVAM
jgi:hypothetical protein